MPQGPPPSEAESSKAPVNQAAPELARQALDMQELMPSGAEGVEERYYQITRAPSPSSGPNPVQQTSQAYQYTHSPAGSGPQYGETQTASYPPSSRAPDETAVFQAESSPSTAKQQNHYNMPEYYTRMSPRAHLQLSSKTSPVHTVSTTTPYVSQPVTPLPNPSTPPPPFRKYWDNAIKTFLKSVGMSQALRGFEVDMLVLNSDWEKEQVPIALAQLAKDLERLIHPSENGDQKQPIEQSFEERKLDYVCFPPNVQPQTPTNMTKAISQFLAQNRARNDASNRTEFLLSLAEKRRKLDDTGKYESTSNLEVASCARVDAKTQDRDVQMKYDIAKNDDGPLRKTVKNQGDSAKLQSDARRPEEQSVVDEVDANRYPAIDERLRDIETHVAIRYVPSPPYSLLDRLKFLEDHLVQLEREYPPWAALHFNQPHRGWPPPPRPTPIIVPSHLTSSSSRTSLLYHSESQLVTAAIDATTSTDQSMQDARLAENSKAQKAGRQNKSSLHRAVMEKLEVQKAMHDLAGIPDNSGSPT